MVPCSTTETITLYSLLVSIKRLRAVVTRSECTDARQERSTLRQTPTVTDSAANEP
ncbi:unnamed protein product [Ectocarpus sp. 12 AP-2014]